jgi:hypothetical protein
MEDRMTTQRVEDIIIDEIQANRELLIDLVERVAKLEVKYSWVAGIYGTLGGLIAALTVYFSTRGG